MARNIIRLTALLDLTLNLRIFGFSSLQLFVYHLMLSALRVTLIRKHYQVILCKHKIGYDF